jgi:hypothetical protein
MRSIYTVLFLVFTTTLFAQSEKAANVYPSNLEENMYFTKFNQATNTIEGVYFLVLSDGDNSRDYTPAFEVTLYLLPEGSTSREDLIVLKKYPLKGIYHMGSHEFKNEMIKLDEIPGINPGKYRFGIWVNSNEAFSEDTSDNAVLFRDAISITKATTGKSAKADDGWGQQDSEETPSKPSDEDTDSQDDNDDWW